MVWTDRQLDAALTSVARRHGAIDLATGGTLLRLLDGGRLLRLGYSTGRDYARERLGMPTRALFECLALAQACAGRPILHRAVAAGLVTPAKARAISPVVAEDEPLWTALAITSTLRALRAAVRAAGKEPPAEFEARVLWLRMSPEQQARLDQALALAGEVFGEALLRWQRLGAVARAWLQGHGRRVPEQEGVRGREPVPSRLGASVTEPLRRIRKAEALLDDDPPGSDAPQELDARALRLLGVRRRYDGIFGALALRAVDGRIWAALGYASLEEYCLERLGTPDRAVRERASLERRMGALVDLRRAHESRRLTYSKVLLVAREAHPGNVADLIDRAAGTTWQQTEREMARREDRRNRALGLRCLWAPNGVARTLRRAIRGAEAWSADRGMAVDVGGALALVADHFMKAQPRHRAKRCTPLRRKVLTRALGLCAVPGCSLVAGHAHHVKYRSHGGTDEATNLVGLCGPHHLRAIHHGYLTVEGRAGGRLEWRFATGEVFMTTGGDDVRRVEGERVSEGGRDARWVIRCDVRPPRRGWRSSRAPCRKVWA